MNIGIIDADLIGRTKHNFPNLVCMKLSGYHKEKGDDVTLCTNWIEVPTYDKVYVSKVFTDTPVDEMFIDYPNVEKGGTGFYFDKAPNLPDEVEHHMPDYHLYDTFIEFYGKNGGRCIKNGLVNYTDYSIGYLTRGCFRKCPFCVNQKYDHAFIASPLKEFYDPARKKICLLDDNFLSHPEWKRMLVELQDTGKPFLFKQGLDERLLTREKCESLFASKYDGDYTFAFDDIRDYDLIVRKLNLIREFYSGTQLKFYVLTGFDRAGRYDDAFWVQDIKDLMTRIKLLASYQALPYVMKHMDYLKAPKPIVATYNIIRRWANFVASFKKLSLAQEFSEHPMTGSDEGLEWFKKNVGEELLEVRWKNSR